MKRFFKIKRKKSPQSPLQPIPPANPAEIAARPPGPPVELNPVPEGEYNRGDDSWIAPDLTVTLDEGGGMDPHMVFLVGKDRDQERPASEVSAPGVVIGGTSHRSRPTGEHSRPL